MVIDAFDSPEEAEFDAWCREAEEAGLITRYQYHPDPFKLSDRVAVKELKRLKTKTKEVERFLLHPHEYTPDFRMVMDPARWNELRPLFTKPPEQVVATDGFWYVDVKPTFSRFHDAKQFSINQKWVYQKYGIFINKIVPVDWFRATWVPELARRSPKKGILRKRYAALKTIEDIKKEVQ